jgi:large subunit ribosomal protein L23
MKHTLKKPLVTEKNTYHGAVGMYVFEVDFDATKTDIRAAVEKNFKVKVASVRTMVCRGHQKKNRFAVTRAPYWKKALVKLAAGEKISLFEGA